MGFKEVIMLIGTLFTYKWQFLTSLLHNYGFERPEVQNFDLYYLKIIEHKDAQNNVLNNMQP